MYMVASGDKGFFDYVHEAQEKYRKRLEEEERYRLQDEYMRNVRQEQANYRLPAWFERENTHGYRFLVELNPLISAALRSPTPPAAPVPQASFDQLLCEWVSRNSQQLEKADQTQTVAQWLKAQNVALTHYSAITIRTADGSKNLLTCTLAEFTAWVASR